jgi:hypothetical protein
LDIVVYNPVNPSIGGIGVQTKCKHIRTAVGGIPRQAPSGLATPLQKGNFHNFHNFYIHKQPNRRFNMNTRIITLTAALALAITLTLAACEEKKSTAAESGSGVKLLKSIYLGTSENLIAGFEYDSKDHIVKVSQYSGGNLQATVTFTYHDNDGKSVTVVSNNGTTTSFVIDGNTISFADGKRETTITVNNYGYITKKVTQDKTDNKRYETTYQYQGDNMIKSTLVEYEGNKKIGEATFNYKYDDKKSPFYNSKTPKWLLQEYILGLITIGNTNNLWLNNNITETSCSNSRYCAYSVSTYEYGSDGFPIGLELSESFDLGDEGSDSTTDIATFTYIGK